MKIGYVRAASPEDRQNQLTALHKVKCTALFEDEVLADGASETYPGLVSAIELAGRGDVLIVYRVDVIGRSLAHLVDLIADLGQKSVGFRSLTEAVDTTSEGGQQVIELMKAMAKAHRQLLSSSTKRGLSSARARGKKLGRPPLLTEAEQTAARTAIEGGEPISSVAVRLNVHPRTLKRALEGAVHTTSSTKDNPHL